MHLSSKLVQFQILSIYDAECIATVSSVDVGNTGYIVMLTSVMLL